MTFMKAFLEENTIFVIDSIPIRTHLPVEDFYSNSCSTWRALFLGEIEFKIIGTIMAYGRKARTTASLGIWNCKNILSISLSNIGKRALRKLLWCLPYNLIFEVYPESIRILVLSRRRPLFVKYDIFFNIGFSWVPVGLINHVLFPGRLQNPVYHKISQCFYSLD